MEEAGARDTPGQALIHGSLFVLKEGPNPANINEVMKRAAGDYTMIKGAAAEIMKNPNLFSTVTRLLEFPHHQNMGAPNVSMYSKWNDQEGHGQVSHCMA